jgi:hypothetical protein
VVCHAPQRGDSDTQALYRHSLPQRERVSAGGTPSATRTRDLLLGRSFHARALPAVSQVRRACQCSLGDR